MTSVGGRNSITDSSIVARYYSGALFALLPLLFVYWSTPYDEAPDGLLKFSNAILPFYFAAVMGLLGYRVAKGVNGSIWTPLVWFPFQSALFYGMGPLVGIYGNELTRTILEGHYLAISPQQLFRAHQLSVTGIFTVLLGITLHASLRPQAWKPQTTVEQPLIAPFKLGLIFLVVGGLFKYLLLYPAQWKMIDVLVPGVLTSLGGVVDLGFAIIAFCAVRRQKKASLIMLTLYPAHIFLTVLSFSKLQVVIALLLPVLAAFVVHRSTRKLFINLGLIAGTFMILQNYVHYGRAQIYEATGTITQAGYVERTGYLLDYLSLLEQTTLNYHTYEEERQGWWTRLNFSGPQVHAMELYDNGFANPQLQDAWVRFIPRAIWPEKPILHGPGLYLYRLLSSNEDAVSFLGLSIYGDLYWQYGWAGVIIGGVLVGCFLAILITHSLIAIRRQEFLMMPFVLMSLQIGLLGPNKFIVVGFIGNIPILLFYFLLITGLSRILKALKSKQRIASTAQSTMSGKIQVSQLGQ